MAHAKPTVMFVLDRSSSMSTNMDGSLGNWSRWQALGSALAAALPSVDDTMAIGALLFSTASTDDMNCSVASKVDLQPALGNVAKLTQLLSISSPGGYTPTAQALDTAARLMLGMRAATQVRALVLATDGVVSELTRAPRAVLRSLPRTRKRPTRLLLSPFVLDGHAFASSSTSVTTVALSPLATPCFVQAGG